MARRGQRDRPRPRTSRRDDVERVLDSNDATLLDIVDNVLNKGVVLSGDLTIALAQVDLVYVRLSLLLCAADRLRPRPSGRAATRRQAALSARSADADRAGETSPKRDPTPGSTASRSAVADRRVGKRTVRRVSR